MNNIVISTTPEKLLAYRNNKDKEIFMEYENSELYFYCNTDEGFTLKAFVPNPKMYQDLFPFVNEPVRVEELMIRSHNFCDNSTWPVIDQPDYVVGPYPNYKLYINSIIVRFPENADLKNTPLTFTVNKYVPQYNMVVPAVQDTYTSIQELLVQSNSPWNTIEFTNQEIFVNKMIEIKFRYANTDTSNWSKLMLSGKHQETIVCSIGGTGQLTDTNGNLLTDPAYAIFNTKRVKEF